ncbi:MAG TPA: D-alanyl-D-alanine carboxypeptidase [Chryseolinea sp.]|nr:D-alanyl-D-alanine carboxypeptidase [Chryseolinea sp.]HPH46243.1 D-alanyl-D-alanine carboxypeptidase [Chryseolinea sp.]HPM28874.1 D-alanyl-D-alanine carboxypeptidase [Chryseolinea sp.]
MRVLLFAFATLLFISSCSPISKRALTKTFKQTESKFQDHNGFVLYDLQKKETVFSFNSEKYFTPASNTKIFTLYASLNIIGDSIPGLRYVQNMDSLIFWGTGDPTFLYKNTFTNDRIYSFLASTKQNLYFSSHNFNTDAFGSGWAWDDYNSEYSAERFSFPVYGNIFSVKTQGNKINITPSFFSTYLHMGESREKPEVFRSVGSNNFEYFPAAKSSEWDIPFKIDPVFISDLLSDTLKRKVQHVLNPIRTESKTIYSLPADSVYKVMMQESDNMLAEQLLLICAGILSDTLQPEIAIDYVQKNFLNDLTDKPVWVDGSGLSRYNLFTPRSIVQLWNKIYQLVPRERLFSLLATGGMNGTVKNWYKADKPYIFGKTGTLSNNHCMSGYLVTKSGKTLIFSFMNSNYTTTTSAIRKNMQEILNMIYEKY